MFHVKQKINKKTLDKNPRVMHSGIKMTNKQVEFEKETARRMAARAECHKAASKREAAKGNAAMAEWEAQQEGYCRALAAQYGSR